jgi:hypothetical protein
VFSVKIKGRLIPWAMPDDRRTILDRANRLIRQSKVLRKLSDELLQESDDIRGSVNDAKRKPAKPRRKRG